MTVKELKYIFFPELWNKESIVNHLTFGESSTWMVNMLSGPLQRTNKSKSCAAAPANLRINHKGRHKQKAGEFSTDQLGEGTKK